MRDAMIIGELLRIEGPAAFNAFHLLSTSRKEQFQMSQHET